MVTTPVHKTALITGASRGIGYELARLLAADEYDLVLVARNKEALQKLKKSWEKEFGISVTVITKDLSKPKAAQQLFHQVQKKKLQIDLLANNAGFGDFGLFISSDPQKNRAMIDLNISSLTELSQLFAKKMVARKSGQILNVASTAAFQPGPYMAVYFATKSYVLSFSQALGEELRGTGVYVTTLCPGTTRSHFQEGADMKNSRLVKNPNKLPSAEEVAKFAYKALKKKRRLAVHGLGNRLLIHAQRFLPRGLIVRVTRSVVGPR